jgi:CRP/FNR family cyclic AMP-dependent transcriptional regulator
MSTSSTDDLAAIPLLASLAPEELQLFAVRSYPKNAIVATEGDRLDMFNVILSGRINFFWRDEAGHQLELGIEGRGGHFVDATLGGEPTIMSVIALEDLRVGSIPMTELKPLLLRHPQVAVSLLMDVVARHRRLLHATRTLTMEDVYARVVKQLLAHAAEIDGKLVTERLTHAEIGRRIGATREMVGRVLRDLARGGYVQAESGRITILRKPPRRW